MIELDFTEFDCRHIHLWIWAIVKPSTRTQLSIKSKINEDYEHYT